MADHKRRRLDNYELLEVVKETASGKIYRARDIESGKEMLLKVLKKSREDTSRGQPRYYEVPPQQSAPSYMPPPYPHYQPARSGPHAGSVIAVFLAMVLVAMGGYKLGGYVKERELSRQGIQAAAPRTDDQGTSETAVANEPEKPAATEQVAREEQAARALEQARVEWDRLSANNDYEGGVLGFKTNVATPFAGTDAAREARATIGKIYRDWGVHLAGRKDFAAAREKLEKALEFLPAGSPYVKSVRERLPALTVQMAEASAENGDIPRALEMYEEAARLASHDDVKAEIKLARADLLWKERESYAAAYAAIKELIRVHPSSQAAAAARQKAPQVLAAGAENSLKEGQYEQARELADILRQDWPDSEQASQAALIEARALFEQFRQAYEDKKPVHNEYYRELFKLHGDSRWARAALRRRLGHREGSKPLSNQMLATLMQKAKTNREAGRYEDAISGLEMVIASSEPTSAEAREALEQYPEWRYEAVLTYHGTGLRPTAMRNAQKLAEHLPHTRWYELAEDYRYGVANTPDGMAFVPEGSFLMGTAPDRLMEILRTSEALRRQDLDELDTAELMKMAGIPPEAPRHPAETGAFYIDLTEVTNQEYKQFCDQASHPTPMHWENGTYEIGQDELPVSNVSLPDAEAYAKWRGGRLPTEAEWEKAARGVDGRLFPWGNKWAADKAHHLRRINANPIKVGTHPAGASPYGCLDMIGNVSEWTSSGFKAYEGSKYEPEPEARGQAVVRGGDWSHPWLVKVPARCASRFPYKAESLDRSVGFRCVIDVKRPAGDNDTVARAD